MCTCDRQTLRRLSLKYQWITDLFKNIISCHKNNAVHRDVL